jgi:hypothetical protein
MEQSTKVGGTGFVNKFRGSVLGAIVACAVSAFAPGTALAGTLDQQQTDSSQPGGRAIYNMQSVGQSFTAGITGGLDQVDLHLGKQSATTTAPLIIEIRNMSGGSPGPSVVASYSLPASAITASTARGWVPILFTAPPHVNAGTQYAIVAYSSTPSASGVYGWSYTDSTHVYAGGNSFSTPESPPSTVWGVGGDDQTFRTYVDTTLLDTTPPETMIGFKKIKGHKATFAFRSSEPGSTFECKLSKHSYKPCNSPKKYKHVSDGKHKFKVRAIDSSGNVDASPARKKFTI